MESWKVGKIKTPERQPYIPALLHKHGIKIPHNIIHRILKECKLASDDAGKQRRREEVGEVREEPQHESMAYVLVPDQG